MAYQLMPRLAQLTKVHGVTLNANDLVIQCATDTIDHADLRMPVVEALKVTDWLSRIPHHSISPSSNEHPVVYEPLPLLAQLTKAHGMVLDGKHLMIQCATSVVEWADLVIPVEEALKLRGQLATLLRLFTPISMGKPDRLLHFPHGVSVSAILEIQRYNYRTNRYMQGLSKDELDQRVKDVMANVITLRDDGKYTLILPRRNGMHVATRNIDFVRLYVELGEELHIRGLLNEKSATPVEKIKRLADESWCRRPDWVNASQHSRESYFNQPKMLFKFGRAEHMRALYERGELLVRPASYFASADGAARQDNELIMSWYRDGQKIEFSTSDYYCWRCASVYDYRLFMDFESDACLAINDPDSFIKRFAKGVAAQVSGAQSVRLVPAYYYDPLSVLDDPAEFATVKDLAIQCAKHFRFAYQWEFRVVITRSSPPPLQPFKFEMGSLQDIAELIVAPAS
ncbi:hypothetical protein QA649_24625 [Bradyrhizobium sp. CB1717]|uniref:hypothetical protein n=1 Tax=Bradyrhizobium sp. CB1717 TaxID=3039154 RepID=UPI0024B1B2E2|nr:hypothetical protein [Bradyrhizobium sp. CB1717]WFU21294.1 hypothetical protein QA649_24625 [Bradyrhizobium sp. CB1717]